MQKIRKIFRGVSEKTALPTKYRSVWFWANLETFSWISPNQYFFFKHPALSLFYLYSLLTSCKKSEKSLEPFWENCVTNQPIITNNTDIIGPRWCWSNKKVSVKARKLHGRDNTKQAEMPYFRCGPSRQENILIKLDQNGEKINIKK